MYLIISSVIIVSALLASGFVYVTQNEYVAPEPMAAVIESQSVPINHEIVEKTVASTTRLFFVGDIMLGRDVENRIEAGGALFPYTQIEDELKDPDLTIGNFEGVIPLVHKQTPSMGFQFSIRESYLTTLKDVGFDVLSLANNHSGDYGESGLANTRSLCGEVGLVCGGSPQTVSTSSVTTHVVNDVEISLVYLSALWSVPSREEFDTLFSHVPQTSDVVIAYVHWGDEYILTHNATQQFIAETLIDRGVDAVIGHHPHVIQDVGLYKGKPIFYSLGNFIFDQYFSQHVQEGLGVVVDVSDAYITYTLIPFSSKEVRIQPRRMEGTEAATVLGRILEPIHDHGGVSVGEGIVRSFR